MKHSTDRILTTHAGSLPRPDACVAMMQAREHGKPYDPQAYAAQGRAVVADIVRKQVGLGLDIVDDGEQGKPGFIPYVNERLTGIEPSPGEIASYWSESREYQAFPEFYARAASQPGAWM